MHVPPLHNNVHPLELREMDVRRTLRSVNPIKAAGPDGIHLKVLQACGDQLAGVFIEIFYISLVQAIVPPCLKSAIVIPISKGIATEDLNDYRVVLTLVIMKCFDKFKSRTVFHPTSTCIS